MQGEPKRPLRYLKVPAVLAVTVLVAGCPHSDDPPLPDGGTDARIDAPIVVIDAPDPPPMD